MSGKKNETIADILAEMRKEVGDGTATYLGRRIINRMEDTRVRQYLDRIEAAWKREKAECEASALSVGGMVEASRRNQVGNSAAIRKEVAELKKLIPQPEPGWKAICEKCHNGEEEPKYCEYYGEPCGCNSPIYGEHPATEKSSAVCIAAAMREALEAFVEYSELVCRIGMFNRDRLVAITTKARDALTAPPRNCDVGTAEERMYRYNRLRDEINERYKRLGEIPPSFAFPTAFEWEDRPYEEGVAE